MKKDKKRKFWHYFFIILFIVLILTLISIIVLGNTYMDWNNKDRELAVLGKGIHSFIWIFMRISPFLLIGSIVGICLTIKKD